MGRTPHPSTVLVRSRSRTENVPRRLTDPVTGLLGREVEPGRPIRTFSDCVRAFVTQANRGNLKRSTKKRHDTIVAHLCAFFGNDTTLTSISSADVQQYIKHRAKQAASSSIADELNLLKRALSRAVESGALDRNVAANIRTPTRPLRKKPTLTHDEFRTLLDVSPNWLRDLLIVAIATSLTQSDLLKIRFRDIGEHEGRLSLRVSKGRDSRFIPLNRAAIKVLGSIEANARSSPDLIFRGKQMTTVNISQAFRRAARSAGLDAGLTFRDLRYVAASWMSARQVPIGTIAAYMGHKTLQMASRHLPPKEGRNLRKSLSEGLSVVDQYLLETR